MQVLVLCELGTGVRNLLSYGFWMGLPIPLRVSPSLEAVLSIVWGPHACYRWSVCPHVRGDKPQPSVWLCLETGW